MARRSSRSTRAPPGTTCLVVDERAARCAAAGTARSRSTSRGPAGWSTTPTSSGERRARGGDALAAAGRSAAIAAIGITNQRETVVVWERRTGRPVHRAIVWQDRRTAARCAELAGRAGSARGRVSCSIRTSRPRRSNGCSREQRRCRADRLAFGTVDAWLVWKLTGGAVHATDARTRRGRCCSTSGAGMERRALRAVRRAGGVLPEVRRSSGASAAARALRRAVPIAGVAGDQQAALFGQGCFEPGGARRRTAPGAFVLVQRRRRAAGGAGGLLLTAAADAAGAPAYALEGAVFVAGAAVQWLRDGLGVVGARPRRRRRSPRARVKRRRLFRAGAGRARRAALGARRARLDRGPHARHGRAHLARAALEAMAYQVADVRGELPSSVPASLRADGGASANGLLMRFQADVLGVPVERPRNVETTAFGAAGLAGIAAGVWPSPEAFAGRVRRGPSYEPSMSRDEVEQRRAEWRLAVVRATAVAGGRNGHVITNSGTEFACSMCGRPWSPRTASGRSASPRPIRLARLHTA